MPELTIEEKEKFLPLLQNITTTIESILLTGITAASENTCQKIDTLFEESLQLGLLQISSSLRIVTEELALFHKQSSLFSNKRLSFFINRAWLLSQSITTAIHKKDQNELHRLLASPTQIPIKKLEVVTLGVRKKNIQGACAFEFHFCTLEKSEHFAVGTSMLWSCEFPLEENSDVATETFLSLPQEQKFIPKSFLENKIIEITDIMVNEEKNGSGKISFTEKSEITICEEFTEWKFFENWDSEKAYERLKNHVPDPLDLEVELQEKIVFEDWDIIEENERDDEYVFTMENETGTFFEAVVAKGSAGENLLAEMRKHNNKNIKKPLYGLVHYERCCLILQPLSLFDSKKMNYITICESLLN